jgi:predicted transcriptional regulator
MQLRLDFNGKKDERITFAAPDSLKQMLGEVATALNRDPSELARAYVIECVTRDRGNSC